MRKFFHISKNIILINSWDWSGFRYCNFTLFKALWDYRRFPGYRRLGPERHRLEITLCNLTIIFYQDIS